MLSFINTVRAVNRVSQRGENPFAGWWGDWSVTRIAVFLLVGVPLWFGARWLCEAMDLTGEDRYESRGALIVYVTALALSAVVSGLVVKALSQ